MQINKLPTWRQGAECEVNILVLRCLQPTTTASLLANILTFPPVIFKFHNIPKYDKKIAYLIFLKQKNTP